MTVRLRDADGWLAVDVADEGPGFAGDPEAAFVRRGGERPTATASASRSPGRSPTLKGGRLIVTRAGPGRC